MSRSLPLAVAAVALAAAVATLLPAPVRGDTASAGVAAAPSPARQRELLRTVRQDCGSCHGLRLTGGLGPALTADALARLPPEAVTATIFHGRPGTPMPPWRALLTEAEAAWIAQRLIEGLPADDGGAVRRGRDAAPAGAPSPSAAPSAAFLPATPDRGTVRAAGDIR